ncbi:MAG: potassium transporter TrkG [Candidatus Diapherotrites archaeon]|nr:potassium transporter TrkG [Candidatus Diapherotrites archaeon]
MIMRFSRTDLRIAFRDLGTLLQFASVFFLIPILLVVLFNETASHFWAFLLPAIACFALGRTLFNSNRVHGETNVRHVLVVSALGWALLALFAAVPLMSAGRLSFSSAVFEAMSALTTTGLSVVPNVDLLPQSVLLWRSLLGWIGGLATITLCVLGVLAGYSKALSALKHSGRVESVRNNLHYAVRHVFKAYGFITVLGVVLLLLAGMGILDAVNYSLNAVSLTGFSLSSAGILGFNSRFIEAIIVLLSLLGATSVFTLVAATNRKSLLPFASDGQFKWTIGIGVIAAGLLVSGFLSLPLMFKQGIEYSLFSAGSAVTTSGFSLLHPIANAAGDLAKLLLILLMLVGGSMASAAGGIKIGRLGVLIKSFFSRASGRPKSPHAGSVHFDGHEFSREEVGEIGRFVVLYLLVALAGTLLLVFVGNNLGDSVFEAVAALGNSAFSSGITNATMPLVSKMALMLLMWIGRLEILPLLAGFGLLLSMHEIRK